MDETGIVLNKKGCQNLQVLINPSWQSYGNVFTCQMYVMHSSFTLELELVVIRESMKEAT